MALTRRAMVDNYSRITDSNCRISRIHPTADLSDDSGDDSDEDYGAPLARASPEQVR